MQNFNDQALLEKLTKENYEHAKPFLIASTDFLAALKSVWRYARDKSNEWYPIINERINAVKDEETLNYCTYILSATKRDYIQFIAPFTKHENERMRANAFMALGRMVNREAYIDYFIKGLQDESGMVVSFTVHALSGIHDTRLLPYYKQVAARWTQSVILGELDYRLGAYGYTAETILKADL
jgi:hypothetical protein